MTMRTTLEVLVGEEARGEATVERDERPGEVCPGGDNVLRRVVMG